jgi:hypothetical protein
LPFAGFFIRIGWTALLLSLCFLSACTKRSVLLPPIPPPTEAPHVDPAHDAQARLLKEAYRAFVQERYPAAALFFRRFVEGAPDSPRLAEARWWLGRTYEHLGDYGAAMAQYRLVAAGPLDQQANGRLYEGHALRRLDELRQLHAYQPKGQARQLAFRVTVDDLPSGTLLGPWLQALVEGGVTALIIGSSPAPTSGPSPLHLMKMKEIAVEAHRVGLLLWVTIDLHQGNGMELKPEWMATTIGGQGQERVSTSRPDLANGVYQSYIEWFTRLLSRTDCDGVFLKARSSTGFSDEFSEESFHAFTASFGTSLSPDDILAPSQSTDGAVQGRPTLYWRWVGWKARGYAKLVMRLRNVLREANPAATMLVEVHQLAVMDPLQGLEQYGEDLVELMSRSGASVAVQQGETDRDALWEKFGDRVGLRERAWLGIPVKLGTGPPSLGGLSQELRDMVEIGRWSNVLLHAESGLPVP